MDPRPNTRDFHQTLAQATDENEPQNWPRFHQSGLDGVQTDAIFPVFFRLYGVQGVAFFDGFSALPLAHLHLRARAHVRRARTRARPARTHTSRIAT